MSFSRLAAALFVPSMLAACTPTKETETVPAAPSLSPAEVRRLVEASPCDIVDLDAGAEEPTADRPRLHGGYPVIQDGQLAYPYRATRDPQYSLPAPQAVRALTGGDKWENEAHDCQRLLVAGNGGRLAYGPLVGLFPNARAMDLTRPWSDPMLAATVFSWGDSAFRPVDYEPLGIHDAWNCLWLRWSSRDGHWQAALTHADRPCESTNAPAAPDAWDLTVVESRLLQGNQKDPVNEALYPKTARWRWDAGRQLQYIGVRCAAAWCSVGAPDKAPPEPASYPLHGSTYSAVVASIPGWRDEQILAVASGSAPRPVEPGPYGIVSPARALWGVRKRLGDPLPAPGSGLFENGGRRSIEIHIEPRTGYPSVSRYGDKFGLEMRPDGSGEASVTIVQRAPSYSARFNQSPSMTPSAPALRVRYVPGKLHSPIGATRWRWSESDEMAWVSCELGCCTTLPRR